MLIGKLRKEMLGSGFRGGVGESPELLTVRLKPNPVSRITLVYGRHSICACPNMTAASKMKWLKC